MKGKKKAGKKWTKPEITVLSPDATAAGAVQVTKEEKVKVGKVFVYYYS